MKKHALLERCTTEEIQHKFSDFPRRYHHYQSPNQENIWTFRIISGNSSDFVIQLIDKTFEPPRGRVCSDQPYIYIRFLQKGENVTLTYWMEWQKWKQVLIAFGFGFILSISLANIVLSLLSNKPFWVGAGLLVISIYVLFLWLVQNKRHDLLAIKVFEELLQKNFTAIRFG